MILWHAQFFGLRIIEILLVISGIIAGLLIGSMARGALVDHPDLDYVPTNELIRSMFCIVACLLGNAFVLSFGVAQIYWTRENGIIQHFNSQGILPSSAYIIVSFVRCSFFGSIQAILGIAIMLIVVEGVGNNFILLLINGCIFSTVWTFICTAVCTILPVAYSAHGLIYLNSVGLLLSGAIIGWKYMYPVYKVVHYGNPLFLFATINTYLFLEDIDTGCEDHDIRLHYGECASGARAYELNGLPMISSLTAQGIGLLYIILGSIGIVCITLKGPSAVKTISGKIMDYPASSGIESRGEASSDC